MKMTTQPPQNTASELTILLKMAQENIINKEILLADKESVIAENVRVIKENKATIELLEQRVALLLQQRYAKRSEKFDSSQQMGLFDEAKVEATEVAVIEEAEAEIQVASFTRKKPGRKPLPANLPHEEIIYDLTAEEKHCACGCLLTEIGADKSEQLDYIPAQAKVIVHVRKKYACKACEETVRTAALPPQPIPKSIATAGLLSQVLVSKYNDHLPLYRQEAILQRMGIDIHRSTLSQWVIRCGALLKPLVTLMQTFIKTYDIAYADETTLQVLKEKGRAPESISYMWYFAGGPPDKRCIIYEYHPTREGLAARNFFKDYQGYIHCDGYAGYEALFTTVIIGVGCWAHARRKFVECLNLNKKNPGFAGEALTLIQKMYRLEKKAKDDNYSLEKLNTLRQEQSKPILMDLKSRIENKIGSVPPQSPLAKAMHYVLNQWQKLVGYLIDPRLEIDNNASERGMKNFAIGRKNWMFSDSPEGAHAGAIIYSLMQTCKTHNVEPYAYFKYVLAALPTTTPENLGILLPFNYANTLSLNTSNTLAVTP